MAGEAYVQRHGGGFIDLPTQTTPADAQFLNAVEAALLRLLGEDPAADEVGIWTPASGRFVFQKIANAHIDAAAAIDKSKLNLAGQITNADINASAAIVKSKLAALNLVNADVDAAAAIAVAKLAASGTNGDVLRTVAGAPAWGFDAPARFFVRGTGGPLTLSASWQDIGGATFTLTEAGTYWVFGNIHWQNTGSGGTNDYSGRLLANGVDQGAYIRTDNTSEGAGVSGTMGFAMWEVTVSVGHVVKLQAIRSTGSGGAVLNTSTSLAGFRVA